MEHGMKAAELFYKGYNCSQAVAVAFCDVTGLDEKMTAKMVSGFGGGVGRMREVCGAVSGMVLVLNMIYGSGDLSDKNAKDGQYARIQAVAGAFKEQCGSIVCRELLGLDKKAATPAVSEERTAAYYKKRPCAELVALAAEITEKYLADNPK